MENSNLSMIRTVIKGLRKYGTKLDTDFCTTTITIQSPNGTVTNISSKEQAKEALKYMEAVLAIEEVFDGYQPEGIYY